MNDLIANDPEVRALMAYEDMLLDLAANVARVRASRADELIRAIKAANA